MNADCWRTVRLIDAQNIDERTCSLLNLLLSGRDVEPMVSGDYSSAIMILREALSCKLRAAMAFNHRAERPKQQS